jgi:hypothetical protein
MTVMMVEVGVAEREHRERCYHSAVAHAPPPKGDKRPGAMSYRAATISKDNSDRSSIT